MKLGLAYFGGFDRAKVDLQKQLGLRYVISGASQYIALSIPERAFIIFTGGRIWLK